MARRSKETTEKEVRVQTALQTLSFPTPPFLKVSAKPRIWSFNFCFSSFVLHRIWQKKKKKPQPKCYIYQENGKDWKSGKIEESTKIKVDEFEKWGELVG